MKYKEGDQLYCDSNHSIITVTGKHPTNIYFQYIVIVEYDAGTLETTYSEGLLNTFEYLGNAYTPQPAKPSGLLPFVPFCANSPAVTATQALEALNDLDLVNYHREIARPRVKACECGADKCGSAIHSTWCPKHD